MHMRDEDAQINITLLEFLKQNLVPVENFDIEFSDDIKSITTEINISAHLLRNGNHLMDLALPDKTLAVMVKRDNKYFIPTGKTVFVVPLTFTVTYQNQLSYSHTLTPINHIE